MKVELIQKEEIKKEIVYPCLMQYIGKGNWKPFIVFFLGDSIGVTIGASDCYMNGEYHDHWKMSDFVPYEGKVVLEND